MTLNCLTIFTQSHTAVCSGHSYVGDGWRLFGCFGLFHLIRCTVYVPDVKHSNLHHGQIKDLHSESFPVHQIT